MDTVISPHHDSRVLNTVVIDNIGDEGFSDEACCFGRQFGAVFAADVVGAEDVVGDHGGGLLPPPLLALLVLLSFFAPSVTLRLRSDMERRTSNSFIDLSF